MGNKRTTRITPNGRQRPEHLTTRTPERTRDERQGNHWEHAFRESTGNRLAKGSGRVWLKRTGHFAEWATGAQGAPCSQWSLPPLGTPTAGRRKQVKREHSLQTKRKQSRDVYSIAVRIAPFLTLMQMFSSAVSCSPTKKGKDRSFICIQKCFCVVVLKSLVCHHAVMFSLDDELLRMQSLSLVAQSLSESSRRGFIRI